MNPSSSGWPAVAGHDSLWVLLNQNGSTHGSGAFGIAAGHAGVAAFQLDQAGRRTARTDAHGGPLGAGFRRRGALSIVFVRLGLGHESDSDEMALDHLADGGKERGYIAPAHPLPAARIEHRFQLFHHEADIAAAPEHGADHTG